MARYKENKKSFFKDKKNVVILILSILLFCAFYSYANPIDVSKYENQIKDLKNTTEQLQTEKTNLEQEKNKLEEDKKALEEQKTNLENEKQELTQKVDELSKAKEESHTVAKSDSPVTTSTTSSNKSSSSPVVATSQNTNNSQMVWIGETGTKYHNQSCKTLKGNKYQITLQQAQSEGRQACKVCH